VHEARVEDVHETNAGTTEQDLGNEVIARGENATELVATEDETDLVLGYVDTEHRDLLWKWGTTWRNVNGRPGGAPFPFAPRESMDHDGPEWRKCGPAGRDGRCDPGSTRIPIAPPPLLTAPEAPRLPLALCEYGDLPCSERRTTFAMGIRSVLPVP